MRYVGIRGSVAAIATAFVLSQGIVPTRAQESAPSADAELAARGVWKASTTYAKDDIVTARGSAWISLRAGNTNHVPGQTQPSSATWWRLFARGFNPLGAWSGATKYQPDDLVTFNGQTYRAKLTNTNKQPTNVTNWELLASKGAMGATGAQGPAGPNTGIDQGSAGAPSISFNGDAGTGIYSPALGKIALVENGSIVFQTRGSENVGVGVNALGSVSSGVGNTAVGDLALLNNTTGGANTGLGRNALFLNSSGSANTAVGRQALASNVTGSSNTAVGTNALQSNTTSDNTAIGNSAASATTSGTRNIAMGSLSLAANATGTKNIAIGVLALSTSTTTSNNIAIGDLALRFTTGTTNVAVGTDALTTNTSGFGNTAVGDSALKANTTADTSAAFGANALVNSTGAQNTGLGAFALNSNSTGSFNTGVGRSALGQNTTGSGNIAVGNVAGLNANASSDSIFIGNIGDSSDTATIRIGTEGTQDKAFMAGIAGTTVANSVAVLIDSSTGQLGTVPSSRRYKDNIEAMPDMAAMLSKLRPVTFQYKTPYVAGAKPTEYGLIAEEVADVFPDLAVFNKDGQPETVKYHLLPSFLLAGYQAQQKTIATQAEEIAELKQRLAAIEAALPKTVKAAAR